MKSLYPVLLICILALGCSPSKSNQTRFVDAAGGLKLRSEPSAQADTITLIPNRAEVTLLQEQGDSVTISGKTGKWSQVKFQDKIGWAFGGFLSATNTEANKPATSSEIDPSFQKIVGKYFAAGSVEPGNMNDWLSISPTSISFGRGGMMEANWYCLVSSASLSASELTVTCDTTRDPSSQEVEYGASRATKKDRLQVSIVGTDVKIDGITFNRR